MRSSLPQRIADAILDDYVRAASASVGDRLPAIHQLEARYSVSRATVVHALGLLKQRGCVDTRHGSGTFVGQGAIPGASHRRLIGYLAPYAETELMARLYHGVQTACEVRGYQAVFGTTLDDYDAQREQLDRMLDSGCRAVVMVPVTRTQAQLDRDFLLADHLDVPIVLVDIAYPEQMRSQVVFDNYLAGYDMTLHLANRGHRRIAFMDFDSSARVMHFSTRERHRGYVAAMRAAGLPIRQADHWLVADHSPGDRILEVVLPFLRAWLEQSDPATALIAIDDFTAAHTIHLARQLGVCVPDQLCFAGFDNTRIGNAVHPSFPTTNPDFRRAGELATEMAIGELEAGSARQVIRVLPAPVLDRESPFDNLLMEDDANAHMLVRQTPSTPGSIVRS